MSTSVFRKIPPPLFILPTVALLLSAFMTWANAQPGTPFLATWARNFATSVVFLPLILLCLVQVEKLLTLWAPKLQGKRLKLAVSLLGALLIESLLAAAIMVGVGFIMRKRAAARQQPSATRMGGMQYATAGAPADVSPAAPAYKVSMPGSSGSSIGSNIGSGIGANLAPAQPRIPADFDVAGFVRNAKVNFIRLQAANDAGNLEDIRQFTTPEMFAELKMDLSDRGTAKQQTDVVNVDGDVLEVAEENGQYVVSVRFTGQIREDGGTPEAFDEIWHLTKPLQGSGGWILSGIQQS